MKKRVLFISPKFFNYEKVMKNAIEKLGFSVDWYDDCPTTSKIFRAVSRVNRNLVKQYVAKYFEKIVSEISQKDYDYFLLVAGMSFSFQPEMIATLRKMFPSARFVVYCWDSVKNLNGVNDVFKYFDNIYSFDRKDVNLYDNITFVPLFYHEIYEKIPQSNLPIEFDYSFIGTAHPKKYRLINEMDAKLAPHFANKYIDLFMPSVLKFVYHKLFSKDYKYAKLSDFNTEKLSHDEILDVVAKSLFILDAPQDGQDGMTIRTIEMLGAKKKLITANEDVVNYDFYRPENVYVYKGEFDFEHPFFTKPYKDLPLEIYKKYSLENWAKVLLNITEVESYENISNRSERISG